VAFLSEKSIAFSDRPAEKKGISIGSVFGGRASGLHLLHLSQDEAAGRFSHNFRGGRLMSLSPQRRNP